MRKPRWLFFVCCIVMPLHFIGSSAWAEPIRVGGTGAFMSAIKQVSDIYRQQHPDTTFQFFHPPMGSSGAIKAVSTNKLDVALSGRPLNKEEASPELHQEWLGRSPFVFVVHKDLPVSDVSLTQLIDMVAGRQKVWRDGSRIRVVLRPVADADTTLIKSISPAMDEAITTAHANRPAGSALADTDTDLADKVEKVPGGLGSVAQAIILAEQRPLKGLILNGVEPSVTTLDNGGYPYAKPLYTIIRADAPPPVVAFVAFLRSPEGRSLLPKLGISVQNP
ncbi:MAG: substrate-binding domain-containing protein [Magnetococcales bacterium]|nr:substrate-binding domain-containing protein [Magnetococcales bacterium]